MIEAARCQMHRNGEKHGKVNRPHQYAVGTVSYASREVLPNRYRPLGGSMNGDARLARWVCGFEMPRFSGDGPRGFRLTG